MAKYRDARFGLNQNSQLRIGTPYPHFDKSMAYFFSPSRVKLNLIFLMGPLRNSPRVKPHVIPFLLTYVCPGECFRGGLRARTDLLEQFFAPLQA